MILAGTGHRPDKLGGYSPVVDAALLGVARGCLSLLRPQWVISGGALGWDQALAWAALDLRIPVALAVPFEGQESRWPPQSQERYRDLRAMAAWEIVVSPGGYAGPKMQMRNRWMVDNGTHVLSLWNGSSGGTANCVRYATGVGRPIYNAWELWKLVDVDRERSQLTPLLMPLLTPTDGLFDDDDIPF